MVWQTASFLHGLCPWLRCLVPLEQCRHSGYAESVDIKICDFKLPNSSLSNWNT